MSDQEGFERDGEAAHNRMYGGPNSGKHPIPTVQGYRQHRKELDDQVQEEEQAQRGPEDESKPKRAYDSAKAIFKDEDDESKTRHDPYPSANLNDAEYAPQPTEGGGNTYEQERGSTEQGSLQTTGEREGEGRKEKGETDEKSATEAVAGAIDPKEKRKAMKKKKRHGEGREVTDPITHLPIVIHDQTAKDLESVPENEPEPGTHHATFTGPQGASKSEQALQTEQEAVQHAHNGMQRLFPPPDFESTRRKLATVYQRAVCIGLGSICSFAAFAFAMPMPFSSHREMRIPDSGPGWQTPWSRLLSVMLFIGLGATTTLGISQWVNKKTNEIFDDETWSAARREEQAIIENDEELPESVHWLNSLLGSIWPLVNPDLFASLVDQIEDVMQASLPKAIKMVSVDDMGQGNESIRILGVRWLPTGAASQNVGPDGKLGKSNAPANSDRTNPQKSQDADGEGSLSGATKNPGGSGQQEQEEVSTREGMEAEEGDFVNLELALAYRTRTSSKFLKTKAKNAHLFLKFYLPGGVAIPVWVELRGLVMTLRLRLQLTPDPPFIELCTLTFLGQPKASISCMPLSKHSFSLTDIPLISSFVNSAIDAALAEYVAPKSLTLNLKDMLVGEDFKKDTTSVGVVWIFIKRASGFKQGDAGVGPLQGSSDAYCTISWGKFGKPVASTRIALEENEPSWHEYASILVTPEEINAGERLRLQLWDSDKWTADDDLGRVEVSLDDLMHKRETFNRIQEREDRFTGEDVEETMPGSLVWSVGYFAKTKITEQQLQAQTFNTNIRNKEDLKKHISDSVERKLREADKSSADEEVRQQKAQDYHELENSMIISAPPSKEYVSGILSIQIHNLTGLQIRSLQKDEKYNGGDEEDEAERADDMPNGYCTIILNHKKIFKTRTKPKNSKPFFNAGTERFIRDWRDTEIIVSVRDAREREDDPLIGLVYLPLSRLFREHSQVMDIYSLTGGIGYGKARISMVWRSVELRLPAHISGWYYGTLQIRGPIKPKEGFDSGLTGQRIKVKTNTGHAKLYPSDGAWKGKGRDAEDGMFLAVRKRYSSSLVIEFRRSGLGPDQTSAFAVLWLHEIRDEKDEVVSLKVWKGNKESFRKAQTCCEFDGSGEGDELLGEVEVPLRFWRGLSGYHKSYAARSKNKDMRNVMECLDTITDEGLEDDAEDLGDDGSTSDEMDDEEDDDVRRKKLRMHTNDDSTPSSSDNEDGDSDGASSSGLSHISLSDFKKVKNIFRNPVDGVTEAATTVLAPGHNSSEDGSRGLRGQMRDYKDHHKQLHRKHRGVMQWRAAREVNHVGGKLTQLKGSITNLFHHDDKEAGIETEV